MELIVRDRVKSCEYPSEFTDYLHRYVLEKVIKKENNEMAVIILAYSGKKEDFEYIVEAVNNYESLKQENRILTKERYADLITFKDEAIKQLKSENVELTEFSVKKRTFELYRNKEEGINKGESY